MKYRYLDPSNETTAALLYCPLTDPTSGYHSLAYLRVLAEKEGWRGIDVIDGNIEAFWSTLEDPVSSSIEQLRIDEPGSGVRPSFAQVTSRVGITRTDVLSAIDILRDPVRFYDYSLYAPAVDTITGWMNQASLLGLPGSFAGGFSQGLRPVPNPCRIDHLVDRDMGAGFNAPFERYVKQNLLPALAPYPVVGINVTYVSQLALALEWGRMVRDAYPDKQIWYGGTEVSDVWKYIRQRSRLFELFEHADLLLLGEGESAFVQLLEAVETRDYTKLPSGAHVNPTRVPLAKRSLPVLTYEDSKSLPTPRFDDLRQTAYLSPEPFVYYSPTRGCYWNKCTFCDYGLNQDSPTSPWRQDPVEKMVHDVQTLTATGVRFIYFSVDVLAPATLLRFAERVGQEGIDVRWAAELRLEKYWTPERADVLAKGGCVALSVGFESASENVLKLMNKGTAPGIIFDVISALHENGIGVEMMGFTGFPGESLEDANESVKFLSDHRDKWTFGGLGEFVLTKGAIVAKEPDKFGVTDVGPADTDDIARILEWKQDLPDVNGDGALAIAKGLLDVTDFGRPWMGGLDSPHTLFYHDRFNTRLVDELHEPFQRGINDPHAEWDVNGVLRRLPESSKFVTNEAGGVIDVAEGGGCGPRVAFVRRDGAVFQLPDEIVHLLSGWRRGRLETNLAGLRCSAGKARELARLLAVKRVIARREPLATRSVAPSRGVALHESGREV